jgi:hypothetical protein
MALGGGYFEPYAALCIDLLETLSIEQALEKLIVLQLVRNSPLYTVR